LSDHRGIAYSSKTTMPPRTTRGHSASSASLVADARSRSRCKSETRNPGCLATYSRAVIRMSPSTRSHALGDAGRFDHAVERARLETAKIRFAHQPRDDVLVHFFGGLGEFREDIETDHPLLGARLVDRQELEPGHETSALEHAAFDDVSRQRSSHP